MMVAVFDSASCSSSLVIDENSYPNPVGSDSAATSWIAFMTFPELYPGLGIPWTVIEGNMLNLLRFSDPYVLVNVTNWLTGTIPDLTLMKMLSSDWRLFLSSGLACTITRYILVNLLKLDTYALPK